MLRARLLALPLAALALAACSDSVGPHGGRPLSFSFSTAGSAGGASLSRSPSFDVVVGGGSADSVVIDTAQVVLREIELKGTSAACVAGDADSDEDSDGCEALELGPELVSLPLTPGAASPLTAMVPAGSYEKMEFKVHRVGDGDDDRRDSLFLARHPEFRNASVRVTGTHRGQRFVYTSQLSAEVELKFDTPVVVDAGATNVTVNVDVGSWFRSASGATLAPTSENASLIADRIRASFRAFEDDDRDGEDSDEE